MTRRFAAAAVAFAFALPAAAAQAEGTQKRTLAIYRQKCQACHKADGTGLGKEMNLTDGLWTHGASVAQVTKVIADGVKGTAMMGYRRQLTVEEIDALARYVRAFDLKLKPEPRSAHGPPLAGTRWAD